MPYFKSVAIKVSSSTMKTRPNFHFITSQANLMKVKLGLEAWKVREDAHDTNRIHAVFVNILKDLERFDISLT
jgi:hypothetical protein